MENPTPEFIWEMRQLAARESRNKILEIYPTAYVRRNFYHSNLFQIRDKNNMHIGGIDWHEGKENVWISAWKFINKEKENE